MDKPVIATLARDGSQVTGRLTTAHAASSYGQPVFVDDAGQAHDWIDIVTITDLPVTPLTTGQAAKLVCLSSRRIRALIANGQLNATRLPLGWSINPDDLKALVRRRKAGPKSSRVIS